MLARPSSMSKGLCPQGAPCPADQRLRKELACQGCTAFQGEEQEGSPRTCHRQWTPPAVSPAPRSWRGNHDPEALRGGWIGLGSRRPGQGQGRKCAVRQDLLNREGITLLLRPDMTHSGNLLSKSKFQGCLLVGRPFLHHTCRHTSMA